MDDPMKIDTTPPTIKDRLIADLSPEHKVYIKSAASYYHTSIDDLQNHGILNLPALFTSNLRGNVHSFVAKDNIVPAIMTSETYEKLMPAWLLFTKFVTEPYTLRYYTTNAVSNFGYYTPKADPTAERLIDLSSKAEIAKWVNTEYDFSLTHEDKRDGVNKYHRIYLAPVDPNDNINLIIATSRTIDQLHQYTRYVIKADVARNVFAQADINKKRTHVSDSMEIQFSPDLLQFAADIDPSQDYDLFLRLCWILATTIGHELIHVINFIRFHDTESGHNISLEDEFVIWNSRANKECEDGFAWEIDMFGFKLEPLPYPEYYETRKSQWNPITSTLIPKYGMFAYEWPEGGKLLDHHKRWAVSMNYIAQWFSEENWEHIGSTGKPMIEDPRSSLEIEYKRRYGVRILDWRTLETIPSNMTPP
ncbi:hypothetical protein BU16DRAFT_560292 [Lophium mytilinum]|uniref:Uncharacterized protein n=1 Tax=Lophium mytilinum TaxID=390894 RepID=A0A6A6QXL0_9PEZI|nr:hypothetical protein BU16DRAFT_560292 [Lophium mytilinum]